MANQQLSRPATPIRLSQLDIVIARYAHAHAHGGHATTPLVGCYLCLHGVAVPTSGQVFRLAA